MKRGPFNHAQFLVEFTRQFPCQHLEAVPCERFKSTGQRFYRVQCLECGTALSGQLKFEAVGAWLAAGRKLGKWDEARYREIVRRRFAAAAEIKRLHGWDAYGFWVRYDAYLLSEEWQERRRRILARDGHKCQQTGCSRPAVQVHHLTYERVGEERDTDLTSVCLSCHKRLHLDRTFQ